MGRCLMLVSCKDDVTIKILICHSGSLSLHLLLRSFEVQQKLAPRLGENSRSLERPIKNPHSVEG